ncbi:hypothetical protein [Sporosarcina luteola]|uniref:hypothetical protein n=1 Tax=Sporosarcina luteola TaxID=582850 RepID=UPI00203DF784|nr:hypothetical protein [Sporosarcina luteola]MCM3711494.1 hypothetical protein [Sporosarcina luteola]
MEYGLNNLDVLKYGDFNEGQIFFIQRWSEMLNTKTHSKYAVRYLNSHQALREILYVCRGMVDEEIKRSDHHLRLVFEEVNKIIEADKLFEKHADSHAKIMKNSLRATPKVSEIPKIYSVIYQLEYVIRHLEINYLGWIVHELKELLQQEVYADTTLQNLEVLIHMLASELLGNGWSLKALYSLVRVDILNRTSPVFERFNNFYKQILSDPTTYVYLFPIKSGLTRETREQFVQFNVELLDGAAIMSTYDDYDLGHNISRNKDYIRVIGKSYDIQTGMNSMWQRIAEYMDVLRFYGYELPDIDTAPIVLWLNEQRFTRNIQVSLVEKKNRFRAPSTIMQKIQMQLNQGNNEVNRKIKSLFEFARISDESLSPQSTFLNLWIGIESFVQSKEHEGGIENVKMVVSSSTTHNYLYSLLKNFIEDCNRCNLEVTIDYQKVEIGKMNPQRAILFLFDDRYAPVIEDVCKEMNILLAYRYIELKDTLLDGKKSSKLLKNHLDNIKQHVQRLYRIRNSIVHSAEVHYNINLFIKHLHEYLESTMSVVLYRLEENPDARLEEIFAQVRDSVEATIETLGNSRNLDKDAYYDLVLKGAF